MKIYRALKWLRVVLALLVFAGVTYFFVFVSAYSASAYHVALIHLLKFQLVPNVLGIATGGVVVVALIILVTLLVGRVYCSVICPFGIYQDVVNRVACWFKTKKQRRTSYAQAHNGWRYGILAAVLLSTVLGFTLPLVYLDPYGLYGKICVKLGRPLVALVSGSEYHGFVWTAFAFAMVVFVTVTLLAAFKGRFYCNTICPVGSLLGLISKHAAFRLTVDMDKCRHCLLCGKSCKAYCLDSKNVHFDYSRCVMCLDCTQACSEDAIHLAFAWKRKPKAAPSTSASAPTSAPVPTQNRRQFLLSAWGIGIGTVLGGGAGVVSLRNKEKVRLKAPMPPGAVNVERLMDKCIACYACVTACPANIIRPSLMQLGWEGIMLPSLNYDFGFCGYECQRCQIVCPTDALQTMSLEAKKRVKLGVAKFTVQNCIIVKEGTDCGACDEHCPVKAVSLQPKEGYPKPIPKVAAKLCIGCGGCQFICPAQPKAIEVVPMPEQRVADLPKIDAKIEIQDVDFGF